MLKSLFTVFVLAGLSFVGTPSAHAGEIWLTIDQVRSFKMPKDAQNIIVGNPEIADVTVNTTEEVFLHGKVPGLTNIFFYDKDGKKLDNVFVRVKSATNNMVRLHRGAGGTVETVNYSCAELCEETVIEE